MSGRLAASVAGLALVVGASIFPAGPASMTYPAAASTTLAVRPAPDSAPDAELAAALRRDLGLSAEQAAARFAAADAAVRVTGQLRRALGDRFGGAWLDPAGRVVAAVTDRAALAPARAAGAHARLVAHGETALTAIVTRLDRAARSAPPTVTGWYVDLAADSVVLLTRPGGAGPAAAFAVAAGVPPSAVRVVADAGTPRPLAEVRGGDLYFTAGSGRCTVGFTVVGGFLTAGHCGRAGDLVYAANGQVMGVFQASSYPGNDYAWVRLNPGWTPVGQVRGGPTGFVSVHGATDAPVGAAVCRYGTTTGWRCGTVQAKNQTIFYAGGSVSGLTRTSVCAEPGDSAGPFMAGNQAQGILSGGSGNCTTGGTTFFQPVREPLAAYGLTLLTFP